MRIPTLGARNQSVIIPFKNVDTATILPGAPGIMIMNGTDDGLAIVNASNGSLAANQFTSLFAGIAGGSIASGSQIGDLVAYGTVMARVVLQTRSASTAAFASWPAVAIGDFYGIESVNAGVSRTGPGTATNLAEAMIAVAAQSIASGTTLASSAANSTATVATTIYNNEVANALTITVSTIVGASGIITQAKAFVRAM